MGSIRRETTTNSDRASPNESILVHPRIMWPRQYCGGYWHTSGLRDIKIVADAAKGPGKNIKTHVSSLLEKCLAVSGANGQHSFCQQRCLFKSLTSVEDGGCGEM